MIHKLTDTSYIKYLLNKYTATQAKKKFGQNFLMSEHVLNQIVETAQIEPTDTIVEIGPGLGVLTRELCLRAHKVIAIEKDRDMLRALRETILDDTRDAKEKITILQQDALQFDPSTISSPYKLVANLPYNVATPILENFLVKTAHTKHQPTRIAVLIQKEVAEKACAKTGDHNVLSLTIQPFGKPEIIAHVPPGSFFPSPKVTSSILLITPYETPLLPEELTKPYFRFIHAAFSQKRKMLGKSLQQIAPKEAIRELLSKANIPPEIRPQELTLDHWLTLARLSKE